METFCSKYGLLINPFIQIGETNDFDELCDILESYHKTCSTGRMSEFSTSNMIYLTKRRSRDGLGQDRVLSISEIENLEYKILVNT